MNLFACAFTLLLSCALYAQESISTQNSEQSFDEIVLVSGGDNHAALIESLIKEQWHMCKVSFASDCHMTESEFFYLTDLKEGKTICALDLQKAVSYLFMKNKFEKITIRLSKLDEGYHLHFDLLSYWTFKKLKFHGILTGKDNLANHYSMEAGDIFDQKKHDLSISKIEQIFKNDGYFDCLIKSNLDYHQYAKQVTVNLTLKKGSRFIIDAIRFHVKQNNQLVDADTLIAEINSMFFGHMRRNAYNIMSINKEAKDLKRFLEKKGYLDVSIKLREEVDQIHKSVRLIFTIKINHKKEFVFSGNHFFSNDQLLDLILLFGNSACLLPASILSQEIIEAYHKEGFWNASIDAQEEGDRYHFIINEGPRIAIKKVTIQPMKHFVEHRIVKRFFSSFIKSKFYSARLLKLALESVQDCYAKEGFLDFKIVHQDFVPISGTQYQLNVTIDEGQRCCVKDVFIDAYKDLELQGPFAQVKYAAPKCIPFNNQLLFEQRRWLLDYFNKQGYANVAVSPDIVHEGSNVIITWHVTLSTSKIHFGKTVLIGSTKFPFDYMKRELQFKENEVWDKEAVKQSFLRLKSLEIFEHIHIYPYQIEEKNERAIFVKLQEDDPYELRFRAGLELPNFTQNYSIIGLTYRLGGAFLIKSPFNAGDQIRVDADFAQYHREFAAKYMRPWIYNSPIKTLMMVYSNEYAQPGFIGSKKNIYDITQQGFLLGLSRKYDHIDAGLNIGFEWMKTTIPDTSHSMVTLINSASRAIDFDPRLLKQNVPFFQIEPSIMIDYLDQKINPTHGSFTVLSLKGMFPLQKNEINTYFVKALAEHSFFVPYKSAVAAMRLRLGHIFFRKFNAIMPIERFYLGGANSLRGYETDFAPPIGKFYDCGKEQFAPQGGKTMVNANVELRFPLYKRLGGVIFQDVGALSSNCFADFNPKNVLASTGFGLRLATPVGPLRFDMGFKWGKHLPQDRSFAWFLTFGQAF
jgi:outer membrane protein assembly complex protein YaeT